MTDRIARVEAFVVKVPPPGGKTYWGKASWGKEEARRNLLIAEHWIGDNPIGDAILTTPMPKPRAGYIAAPSGPGVGVEVDEAAVRSLAGAAPRRSATEGRLEA